MRGSFLLGIIGGIFAILIAFGVFFIAAMLEALGQVGFLETAMGQVGIGILGGVMGIVGGAIGKRSGGALLIVGSLLSLIGAGLFGILPFVLLLIGGILAIKEKREDEKTKIHKPKDDKMEKKVVGVIILSIVVLVLIVLPILIDVLELMPEAKVKEGEEKPTPTPTPTSQKNLLLMETSYNPAFNFTVVKFANIGSKTLYNITVVSEFGERVKVFEEYAAELRPGQGFQVGLKGMVSKVTVQYSIEPNGTKLEEKFEWTW